jgi:hypothetical protein
MEVNLVEMLRKRGYCVRRDNDLINRVGSSVTPCSVCISMEGEQRRGHADCPQTMATKPECEVQLVPRS